VARTDELATARVVRRWALLVVVVLVTGVAVWVTSPRFALETPSLVDDWSAISRSSDQLADVFRLQNPEEQRFRPGWIAWNYLQWNTLDAPGGDVGPNLWNVVRILVLVAGLTLLTALALPPPRGRASALLQAALAGAPALLVVTVPKFAVDLARFGPQEPLLLGGMALGGSLLVLAGRRLLDGSRAAPVLALAIVGGPLWALGAYHKESSLAVLPLLAAVLYVGRDRLRGWRQLSAGRRGALAALGAVVFLPLVHVAIESARIAARGDLVYGAEVDAGKGIWRGLGDLWDWRSEALPWKARAFAVAALVAFALATVVRRRLDPIALGTLASAALTIVLAAQSGTVANRYFIPAFALLAVAFALSVARLPLVFQVAGLLAVASVLVPPPGARAEVSGWADVEEEQGDLVRRAAELQAMGCTIQTAGLLEEAGMALPVLLDVERVEHVAREAAPCQRNRHFLVGPQAEGQSFASGCATDTLVLVQQADEAFGLYRCVVLPAR
jgi:hypothetical protein